MRLDSTLCVLTNTVGMQKKTIIKLSDDPLEGWSPRSRPLVTALEKLAENPTIFHLTQSCDHNLEGVEAMPAHFLRILEVDFVLADKTPSMTD